MTKALPTLRRQVLLCLAMCSVAIVLMVVWPPPAGSLYGTLALAWRDQVLVGGALGLGYWAIAEAAYRFLPNGPGTQAAIDSYNSLGLEGWRPLWIALAAGLGEELLFRGALQPHLGIWLVSALFALAHLRAYRISKLDMTAAKQLAALFGASVVLGALAYFLGIVTAIVFHVSMDVIGLSIVRRASSAVPSA